MPSQKDDLAFGTNNETAVMSRLEEAFNTSLERFGGFATIDYANPTRSIWVELKSRRIKHNQYPTALIGANKVAFCSDATREYYFVFHYSDGLYYIKYNKEVFDGFRRQHDYRRGDRDDCRNYDQSVVHIPVEHLDKLPKCIFA